MRARLLFSHMIIAAVAILVLGIPLGILGQRAAADNAQEVAARQAEAIAELLEVAHESDAPVPVERIAALIGPDAAAEVIPHDGEGGIIRIGTPPPGAVVADASGDDEIAVTVFGDPSAGSGGDGDAIWLLIALMGALGLLASAGLAVLQSRRLARPLEDLARASSRLGSRDFSAGRHGLAEVDELAEALDRNAARIADLLERERAFSANVSHQMRTPLAAIGLRLEELTRSEDEEVRTEARAGLDQVERLTRTIDDLLALAREGRAGDAVPVRVDELVRERVAGWRTAFEGAGRPVPAVRLPADPLIARASPGAVEQALDVLLDNALQHGAGAVEVVARESDGYVSVGVTDEGPGIPDARVATLFGGGPGRGLGLPLARTMIEAGGGRVRVSGAPRRHVELLLVGADAPPPAPVPIP